MSDFAGEQYKKARKAGIKAFREAGMERADIPI